MLDLRFRVDGVRPTEAEATSSLAFRVSLGTDGPAPGTVVESVLLRYHLRIEPQRRTYDCEARARLFDLFGTPEQWARTLRSLAWTEGGALVPRFRGHAEIELPVPCPTDGRAAATKYFAALADGDVPLTFQFSGTIFHSSEDTPLQVSPISHEAEATFRLPVQIWRDAAGRLPGAFGLNLGPGLLGRLDDYKRRIGCETREAALECLLDELEARRHP